MKSVKLSIALAAALLATPFVSFAQEVAAPAAEEEASSPWAVSLAATTDYVFRGVSQTDNGPAFQAGVTYSAPFGIYAGVWGSNVDFGGTGGFETDYYVGWNKDLSDSWNLDLGATRYTYSGDGGFSGDYDEIIGKITWSGPVTVTGLVAYAPDYGDLTPKAKESYANLTASYGIGETGFTVAAGVGYTSVDYGDETIEGEKVDYGVTDYFDGSVSVSKGFGPATATLGYYDTFSSDADELRDNGTDNYKPGLVLTVAVALP